MFIVDRKRHVLYTCTRIRQKYSYNLSTLFFRSSPLLAFNLSIMPCLEQTVNNFQEYPLNFVYILNLQYAITYPESWNKINTSRANSIFSTWNYLTLRNAMASLSWRKLVRYSMKSPLNAQIEDFVCLKYFQTHFHTYWQTEKQRMKPFKNTKGFKGEKSLFIKIEYRY